MGGVVVSGRARRVSAAAVVAKDWRGGSSCGDDDVSLCAWRERGILGAVGGVRGEGANAVVLARSDSRQTVLHFGLV